MDVLQEYLDYQVFMVWLAHAHAVDTRFFLLRKEGPGDEAKHVCDHRVDDPFPHKHHNVR